jgi:Zn-finger protein
MQLYSEHDSALRSIEASKWEYVYGPTNEWHLTCSTCGNPIYRGQEALITEDAEGRYVRACQSCPPCRSVRS